VSADLSAHTARTDYDLNSGRGALSLMRECRPQPESYQRARLRPVDTRRRASKRKGRPAQEAAPVNGSRQLAATYCGSSVVKGEV
jgi:hypothetical protein